MPPEHMSSSSTAQPTPSSSQDTPNGFRNSSNLYLITFMATLFLLLFISFAIVLRSFVVRRRYRRQLDEAYAAGIILAPLAQGSRRRRYGHRPKLYTSWVVQGGERWTDMMPVSALPVQSKRRNKNLHSSKQDEHHQQPPSSSAPSSIWRLLRGMRHDHITRPPTIVTNSERRVDRLQVSVLIAMPSPNKPANSRSSIDKVSDEDSIPNVVFGVTRTPYKYSNQIGFPSTL